VADITVATRYAKALFRLSVGDPQRQEMQDRVLVVIGGLFKNRDFRKVLISPVMPMDLKVQILEYAAKQAQADEEMLRFVRAMVTVGRVPALEHLGSAFRRLVNTSIGRVDALVTSAVTLSEAQVDKLRQSLESMTQKSVTVTSKIDQDILGGVLVRIDNDVIDMTLKNRLKPRRPQRDHFRS
jgi:F-type H+-transporting ATPase subunit delta